MTTVTWQKPYQPCIDYVLIIKLENEKGFFSKYAFDNFW